MSDGADELPIAGERAGGHPDECIVSGQLCAEYRRLIAEQAALRRLALLVARGVEPMVVYGAVAEEMRRCVPADAAGLWRFETNGDVTLVAAAADPEALAQWPVGTRTPMEGNTLATRVQRTGRPARMDSYETVPGPIAARVRAVGVRAAVGVPIIVDGRVRGLAALGSTQYGAMSADTEVRITRFAELATTAVVAGYRDEQKRQLLAEASRRLARAADYERRRIERDLHDGAQQHLVTLALNALAAEALAPAELGELKDQMARIASGLAEVSSELQEISRGIPPAILAEGGLLAAIQELAHRSPVPVQLDVALADALPEPIQVATYYLVAEALTNTAKHAHAGTVEVHLDTGDTDIGDTGAGAGESGDRVLRVWVRDDGRGGAEPHGGSGLVGLNDRVQALGGRLWLHSPPGTGTTVRAELPLTQPPAPQCWFGCSCQPAAHPTLAHQDERANAVGGVDDSHAVLGRPAIAGVSIVLDSASASMKWMGVRRTAIGGDSLRRRSPVA